MPTGELQWDQMPTGELQWDEMPTGELQWDEMPTGELQWDEMPMGELLWDEMPTGRVAVGQISKLSTLQYLSTKNDTYCFYFTMYSTLRRSDCTNLIRPVRYHGGGRRK
jgi:hypothetical protein